MYSPERTAWWIAQSKSPEHAKAYDRISSQIVLTGDSVAIDFCCGNGELLRRLYENYERRAKKRKNQTLPLIIGTDIDENMLQLAADNLRSEGIDSVIIEKPEDIMKYKGVVLVQDDMSNSRLPSDISDVSFLTFPQMKIRVYAFPELIKFTDANPNMGPDSVIKYFSQYHPLSRITKKGRNAVITDYDNSWGEGKDEEGLRLTRELGLQFNLEQISTPFFASSEVFGDIDEDRQREIKREGGRIGYRIWVHRKL